MADLREDRNPREKEEEEVEEDLEDFPEEADGYKDVWYKRVLRFFFSFVGLFILLVFWTVLGAYYFYAEEKVIEDNKRAYMEAKAADVDSSRDYIADRMSYILYDTHGGYNNCTVFTDDPFYEPNFGQYSDVCLDPTNPRMNASRFCHCIWLFKRRAEMNMDRMVKFIVEASTTAGYNLDAKGNPVWDTKWTFTNSLLFTMTTLTLIGYGHIAPTTQSLKIAVILYALIGLPLAMVFLANIGGIMADFITYLYSRGCCRWCRVRRKRSELDNEVDTKPTLKHDKVGTEEYMPTDDVLVPITITLCIMAAYCAFGALIYVSWEQWELMDACYFTFITLSTIGFGDFVPGKSFTTSGESDESLVAKMIFTTLYCLLGLALIAMGISLVQESIATKASSMTQQADGLSGRDDMDKYILTIHYNVKETPPTQTGNKLSYNKSDSIDDEDFTNLQSERQPVVQSVSDDEIDLLLPDP
eukprot:maker-scaffold114_size351134-snap-gene-2.15 protein:Tk09549 transcript:maker-scaffold114_size351134-snap-gene-2.15-mRNA-1 annotation:"potassium channel subfamily k member 3-like"